MFGHYGDTHDGLYSGSDTTSTTLTATIFYLLHNPDVLSTLTHEIRSSFSNIEEIRSGPQLNSCIYLRACIDEALRMSPPVGAVLPRCVLPGGLEVLGHKLPAGVGVGVPIYAIHHHVDFVPEPFAYNPSRWIIDDKRQKNSTHVASNESLDALHSVFNPFSLGSRGCIGRPMAYLELSLTLARLVWSCDMRLAPGDEGRIGGGNADLGIGRERPGEFQMRDIFVSEKEGPLAQFRSRG
jgi:cytochrome P450